MVQASLPTTEKIAELDRRIQRLEWAAGVALFVLTLVLLLTAVGVVAGYLF